MKKIQKVYDRAFKEKAVMLSYERNSITEVEKELGITSSLLNRWRQDHQKYGSGSFPGCGYLRMSPEQEKIYLLEKRIAKAQLQCLILKNAIPYLCQKRNMIYQYIKSCEKIYSAKQICKLLGIDQRCYSKWKNNYVPEKHKRKLALMQEITSVFFAMEKRYGYMRITPVLRKKGIKISTSKTARYMKELGLSVSIRKP